MNQFFTTYKQILNRAKLLLLNPKQEWENIALENIDSKTLTREYLVYLALVPALVGFIGYSLVGYRVQFVGLATSFILGLKLLIYFFITTLLNIYLSAKIIQYFANKFGAEQSFSKVFELISYCYTAIIGISLLNISPAMGRMVSFLNLYCIYIFFFGLKR